MRWINNEHRQGEMGGSLHPQHHGKGLAVEVYRELLEIGFGQFSLHRIVGRCDARNVASIRALEKAGLVREAHFIENEFVKGEWTDEVVLAIRKAQWERREADERG
jgi:RimJ/RimL family protein N-acetyltransferase